MTAPFSWPTNSCRSTLCLLLYSSIFFALSVVISSLAVAYTNLVDSKDYPNYKPRLHDVIIDNVPESVRSFQVTELTIEVFMLIFVLLLVVHRQRCVLLRRYLLISGSVFLMRSLCLVATQLSVPHSRSICPKRSVSGTSTFVETALSTALTFGLMSRGMLSCGDYLFSGHAATILIFALFFVKYTQIGALCKFALWSLVVASMICVVSSYMHYTVDVVVAIIVVLYVFHSYHMVADLLCLYQSSLHHPSSFRRLSFILDSAPYYNLTAFLFERGVGDVTNEYETWFINFLNRLAIFLTSLRTRYISRSIIGDFSTVGDYRNIV